MPEKEPGAHDHHRQTAPRVVNCFVLTVSDSRTAATDRSGGLIGDLLKAAGHRLTGAEIVPDEPDRIRESILVRLEERETDAIIITGGTGISKRDQTVDAVRGLLERDLPGFGELFRMLSFREVGSAAMLSRALGGVVGEKVIFVLPGSAGAVKLAMEQLILPEIGHIIRELRK